MNEQEVLDSMRSGHLFQIVYGERDELYFFGYPAWLQVIPLVHLDYDNGKFSFMYSLQGFVKQEVENKQGTYSSREILEIMRHHGTLDEWEEGEYVVNYLHNLQQLGFR